MLQHLQKNIVPVVRAYFSTRHSWEQFLGSPAQQSIISETPSKSGEALARFVMHLSNLWTPRRVVTKTLRKQMAKYGVIDAIEEGRQLVNHSSLVSDHCVLVVFLLLAEGKQPTGPHNENGNPKHENIRGSVHVSSGK
jgi:hypothetical protein